MAEVASAFVSLLPSAKGFGKKLESDVGGDIKGAGKRMGSGFGKVFAVAAGAVAAVGVANFLGGAIADARESQKITALTEQVIKTTGGAAKVTSKQVQDLAGSIAEKTGIDDAAIQSASNLLLTFTNLRNEVGKGNDIFNQATQIATDMGAALGNDPKTAAIQLGKALNDPIKGVTALSKVGVSFTEDQKEQIKTFVESGDTMKAQKVILKELGKEFGGAAEAQATAGDKAAFAFGELKESIGTALIPIVERVSNLFVKRVIPALQTFSDFVVSKVVPPVRRFVNELIKNLEPAVNRIRDAFDKYLSPALQRVGDFIKKNPTFVKAFAIALGVLVGAIGAVTLATAAFSIALNSTGIPLVIIAIAALVAGLVVLYKKNADFRNIVNEVGAGLKSFAGFLKAEVLPVIVSLGKTIAEKAKPVLKQLGATFKNDVLPFLRQVVAKFREAQPTIQKVIGVVVRLYGKFLEFYVTVLGKVIPILVRFVGYTLRNVIPAITTYVNAVKKIIGKIGDFVGKIKGAGEDVADFAKKVGRKIGEVVGFFTALPGELAGALAAVASDLYNKGKQLGESIISGIKAAFRAAGNFVKDLIPDIPDINPLNRLVIPKSATTSGKAFKTLAEGYSKTLNAAFKKATAKVKFLEGLDKKVSKAVLKARKAAVAQIAGLQEDLAGIRDQFRDLATTVGDAFKVDLFSGGLADFFANGAQSVATLKAVAAAFAKLRTIKGISKDFLTSLFESGNSALAIQLAGSDAATVRNAEALFNQQNTLASTLGQNVAANQFGPALDKLGDRIDRKLDRLIKVTQDAPEKFGRQINGAATRGRRDARSAA